VSDAGMSDGSLFSVCSPSFDEFLSQGNLLSSLSSSSFKKITSNSTTNPSFLFSSSSSIPLLFENCAVGSSFSLSFVGSCVQIASSSPSLLFCSFSGFLDSSSSVDSSSESSRANKICSWNGRLLLFSCTVSLNDVTVVNSSVGGLAVVGGEMIIESGNFERNSVSFSSYGSIRNREK
jgi:hypothetical protein